MYLVISHVENKCTQYSLHILRTRPPSFNISLLSWHASIGHVVKAHDSTVQYCLREVDTLFFERLTNSIEIKVCRPTITHQPQRQKAVSAYL